MICNMAIWMNVHLSNGTVWGKYQRLSIGVLINRLMIIRQREIFRQLERKGGCNAFDELRAASRYFSFTGVYQGLIVKLFNHMQYNNGTDFQDVQMDLAYKRLILSDKSENSTLIRIKSVLDTFDFNSYQLNKDAFTLQLSQSRLPKYVRWEDCINGMGVSVHEVNSTEISIDSLFFKIINILL